MNSLSIVMKHVTQAKVSTWLGLLVFLTAIGHAYAQAPGDILKQPSVQWRFKIKQPIFSSPVVNEGVVYFGGLDSTVYALDLKTGAQKWKLRTNGEIRSTLVVHGNQLFLAGGNGVLSCIDKTTGKPIWRTVFDLNAVYLAERRYDFADYYHSTPLIHDNVIYLGSSNGVMRAMKVENGEVLWSFKAGDIIHNEPIIVKKKLYFGCFDGNVYALNIADGTLAWKFKSIGTEIFPKGEFNGSPAANDNTIMIGGRDYNAYFLDANTGTAKWNKRFNAWALSFKVRDTVVFLGTSDDHLLLALDARDGHEIWKTNVKFNIFSNMTLGPNTIYASTIWGRLVALDTKTGAIRWTFDADGFKPNHDQYFTKDDFFRPDIGRILKSPYEWIAAEYKMGGMWSTPAVVGEEVVITTAEGNVYKLRTTN